MSRWRVMVEVTRLTRIVVVAETEDEAKSKAIARVRSWDSITDVSVSSTEELGPK